MKHKKEMLRHDYFSWCEIDLKALKHNLKQILKMTKENRFYLSTRMKQNKKARITPDVLAVIKANAYGHGVEQIVLELNKQEVSVFAVSDVSEGKALRKLGIKKPILLFESTLPEIIDEVVRYNLMPTICEYEFAKQLDEFAAKRKRRIDVHIKVDTGMGRLGVWHAEAFDFIVRLHSLKHLRLLGIFTHFPSADTDRAFTNRQIKSLYELVTRLDREGIIIPYIHAANSMGLAGFKTHILNLTRTGLLLYGLYPHPNLQKKFTLKPVMSVYSKIIFIKQVAKGRSISYGRTFFSRKEMKIATIPIGYNDGYFRSLSNKAYVLIKGKRCKVIGRVTMDQVMVDVSGVKNVKINDKVTIIGKQKNEEISADMLAHLAGTISYEIVCNLGNRLKHVYKK